MLRGRWTWCLVSRHLATIASDVLWAYVKAVKQHGGGPLMHIFDVLPYMIFGIRSDIISVVSNLVHCNVLGPKKRFSHTFRNNKGSIKALVPSTCLGTFCQQVFFVEAGFGSNTLLTDQWLLTDLFQHFLHG